MSDIKLLPCPHCEDGKAVLHTNELTDKYHVTCCDCGCRTADFKHPEEAIKVWNTRKPMERIKERIDEKMENVDYWTKPFDKYEYYDNGFWEGMNEVAKIVEEEGGIE